MHEGEGEPKVQGAIATLETGLSTKHLGYLEAKPEFKKKKKKTDTL